MSGLSRLGDLQAFSIAWVGPAFPNRRVRQALNDRMTDSMKYPNWRLRPTFPSGQIDAMLGCTEAPPARFETTQEDTMAAFSRQA